MSRKKKDEEAPKEQEKAQDNSPEVQPEEAATSEQTAEVLNQVENFRVVENPADSRDPVIRDESEFIGNPDSGDGEITEVFEFKTEKQLKKMSVEQLKKYAADVLEYAEEQDIAGQLAEIVIHLGKDNGDVKNYACGPLVVSLFADNSVKAWLDGKEIFDGMSGGAVTKFVPGDWLAVLMSITAEQVEEKISEAQKAVDKQEKNQLIGSLIV
mgnify:CR=1 FL=1|jgi:hypothetical protein